MRRAVVLVALALFAGACSNGGGSSEGDRANPKEGEVFLEAFGDVGPNAFTSSVALAPVPHPAAGDADGSGQGLRSVRGTSAGFYGGAGAQQLCDPTAGVNLLLEDDDKAQAWVDALNDDADLEWSGGSKLALEDIATYVGELTSLFVRSDVRVTNHGYRNARAVAFQSVLQRGTAVMVDVRGVPRARCASFSPLIPPKPAASPKYRGVEWEGFDKTKLVVITPGSPVETFRVVDVHTKETIEIFAGRTCICDRTAQSSTTTSTIFDDDVTTTTSVSGRTTTTQRRTTTTSAVRPTTTVATTTTTTPPTTTTAPVTTTTP